MTHAKPDLTIGHAHLRVSDLDRAIAFYGDVIGLDLKQRRGDSAAFMSAGGYHHHIGLNTWDSKGGTPPPKGHTGLFHVAFLYPDRPALARAVARAADHGVDIYGCADHGVSQAVYFDDADGNGIELYFDRPEAECPRDEAGMLAMYNERFDVGELIAEGRG